MTTKSQQAALAEMLDSEDYDLSSEARTRAALRAVAYAVLALVEDRQHERHVQTFAL